MIYILREIVFIALQIYIILRMRTLNGLTVSERLIDVKYRPRILDEIVRLGGKSVTICYQCGSCTAICPLSEYFDTSFRKSIKYVQLGLTDLINSDLTPWLCYQCGECNDSCPREAYPGEIMMALRRYKIITNSIGRIARIFYDRLGLAVSLILLSLLALFGILFFIGPVNISYVDIYSFIPYDFIHNAGLVLGIIVGISVIYNILLMYRDFKSHYITGFYADGYNRGVGMWLKEFFSILVNEVMVQRLFNRCDGNKWRYVAHLSLFWGFTGLFISTSIHYIVDLSGIHIDVIYPRLIGIVSGILLIYGTIYHIYKRLRRNESRFKYTYASDWVFLILLFFVGVTGFLTTIYIYMDLAIATYLMYGLHVILVFDLLIIAPFTKFMHALYRPFALLFYKMYVGGVEYG